MFSVKPGVNIQDFAKMRQKTLNMLVKVVLYCHANNMPVTITSLINDRANVANKSQTHASGRAFDLRTRDWTSEQCLALEAWANLEFEGIAAIKGGESRAAVLELSHIHFQSIWEA